MKRGKFITIEGPDGAGKTSVIQTLAKRLKEEGLTQDLLLTREPGGSPIAEAIREVLLNVDHDEMDIRTEALLFAASRRQHLQETVIPAIDRGTWVLCDRFVDSSLAYQGVARGLSVEAVWAINEFAIEGMLPDLTLIIDVPAEVGLSRIHQGRSVDEINRLDKESIDFHQTVRQAFLDLAKDHPRMRVIDGTQPLEQVVEDCLDVIRALP